MGEPIENLYFNWLCAKVVDVGSSNYYDLLEILHRTEFVWLIAGDRNRAEDGIELREDFMRETRFEGGPDWYDELCSIFEMMVAFAKRAQFQTDTPVKDWFWHFMTNLGLNEYRRVSNSDRPVIEDILYMLVWRTYSPNGDGGMFPLRSPREDQRKVEIWYQFCEYLEDQGLF